jgi:ribosome biogenesis protein UTP30
LKFIKTSEKEKLENSAKRSLLQAGEDEEDDNSNETPIWLVLTTKKHIIDKKRLKPAKIAIPNPLNTSPASTICLITADPQRTYKDIIASEAFPAALRARITRVIGVTKVKAKYHQYEAQRKLLAEHEIFLADDRIVTQLPKLLGKTFYKASTKRPVPINMQAPAPRSDGKRIARARGDDSAKETISPQKLALEIEKTFSTALVALSPSVTTSVRIGAAGFTAEQIAENIEAVVNELIAKFVPKKWRGVRSIHIKGPETAAMPIWLADELWTDETDIIEAAPEETKAIKGSEIPNIGKKRKAIEAVAVEELNKKKAKRAEMTESKNSLEKEIAVRKEKLKKQKAEAEASIEDEVPKLSRKMSAGKTKKQKASAVGA